jgi:TetR/AcrR family transcriptional regulator, cholesterol catabolism regulator
LMAKRARKHGGAEANNDGRPIRKREQEIIDAAAEIFRRQGYADTSVQDVADAVGILKGSLYHYIESKEDLLHRMLVEVHEDAHGIVDEVAAMTDLPPLDRLALYIRRHVEYNSRNLTKIAVYYHDFQQLSGERRKEIIGHRKFYEDFVTGLIEEAQERGDVHESVSPRLAAFLALGAMNWIYTWYRPRGKVSPEELGRLCSEVLINGLVGARVEPD